MVTDHLNQSNQITTSAILFNNNNICKNANPLSVNNSNAAGTLNSAVPTTVSSNPVAPNVNEEMRYHGTELVMLYDYKVKSNF